MVAELKVSVLACGRGEWVWVGKFTLMPTETPSRDHPCAFGSLPAGIQRIVAGSLTSSAITAIATSPTKRITAFAETCVGLLAYSNAPETPPHTHTPQTHTRNIHFL